MPAKNSLKIDVEDSYYHVYSRGINRAPVFLTPGDYVVFLSLLKRYLSTQQAHDNNGKIYPHFYGQIDLLAFCLMPNHFHLLIYQHQKAVMSQLMRALMTSYSMYFNKKHKRSGPLFEGRYRASMINNDTYLMHISRYIHLNPEEWSTYRYSSLSYYKGEVSVEWLKPNRVIELFDSKEKYLDFVKDYGDYKQQLKLIKHALANS